MTIRKQDLMSTTNQKMPYCSQIHEKREHAEELRTGWILLKLALKTMVTVFKN
jgi:hypothetical protein